MDGVDLNQRAIFNSFLGDSCEPGDDPYYIERHIYTGRFYKDIILLMKSNMIKSGSKVSIIFKNKSSKIVSILKITQTGQRELVKTLSYDEKETITSFVNEYWTFSINSQFFGMLIVTSKMQDQDPSTITFNKIIPGQSYPRITSDERYPNFDKANCTVGNESLRAMFYLDKELRIIDTNVKKSIFTYVSKRGNLLYGFFQGYYAQNNFDHHMFYGIIHRNPQDSDIQIKNLNKGYVIGQYFGKSFYNFGWFMAKRIVDKIDGKYKIIWKFMSQNDEVYWYIIEDDDYIFVNQQIIDESLKTEKYASCICPNGEILYAGVYDNNCNQVACEGGVNKL